MTYKFRIVDNRPNPFVTVCSKCVFHGEGCSADDHITNQVDFIEEVGSCLTQINSYFVATDED